MRKTHRQNAFNAGELSPRMKGRSDFEKYQSGLAECQNMIALPHGGVSRRSGFQFINEVKNSDHYVELIPFEFSEDQAYVLEFGDQYMRVFADGGRVLTPDSYTKLLLHCDGVDGDNAFNDDGVTGHTITPNGDAHTDDDIYQFANASAKFDGTGDYLSAATHTDFNFGSGRFTIDLWLRFSTVPSTSVYLIRREQDADNYYCFEFLGGGSPTKLKFTAQTGGGAVEIEVEGGSWTPVVNTWYHIAIIRGWGDNDNQWAITINGTQSGTTTTDSDPAPVLTAALTVNDASNGFAGWVDELRISKGIARWTANFTVPNTEYPAAGGGVVYEIATPYLHTDVRELRVIQSADTLYIFHPDYNVRKLQRTDHDNWTLTDIDWAQPPWSATQSSPTLTPGATTGDTTLTASATYFSPADVGAYFYLNDGFCRVTSYTSPTVVNITVKDDFSGTGASSSWKRGVWDAASGYPTMGCFHEDRLICIGSAGYPMTVFMSATSDYEDFGSGGTADSDPIAQNIWSEKQNRLKWVVSGKRLFLGTVGAEFWMTGEEVDLPITPTSILVRKETSYGGLGITPIMVGSDILFAQYDGKKIRSWNYDGDKDSFDGPDVSILGEHFFQNTGIVKIQYAQDPNCILWIVLADGKMLGLTYFREHKVIGFHEHWTNGAGSTGYIESVAVIPGDDQDEVWAVFKRDITGTWERYIERLAPQFFNADMVDATCIDSFLCYDGSPATTFNGLDHLEGEIVQILADGAVVYAMVGDGAITLDSAASVVCAGVPYYAVFETLTPDVSSDAPVSNKLKRIVEVLLQLYEASGFIMGRDYLHTISIPLSATSLTTDDVLHEFYGDFYYSPSIYIKHVNPLPFTILSITTELEIEDD